MNIIRRPGSSRAWFILYEVIPRISFNWTPDLLPSPFIVHDPDYGYLITFEYLSNAYSRIRHSKNKQQLLSLARELGRLELVNQSLTISSSTPPTSTV